MKVHTIPCVRLQLRDIIDKNKVHLRVILSDRILNHSATLVLVFFQTPACVDYAFHHQSMSWRLVYAP